MDAHDDAKAAAERKVETANARINELEEEIEKAATAHAVAIDNLRGHSRFGG
jgi:hypothetical protein